MHTNVSNVLITRLVNPLVPLNYRKEPFLFGKAQAYIICLTVIGIAGLVSSCVSYAAGLQRDVSAVSELGVILSACTVVINIFALWIFKVTRSMRISYSIAAVNALLVIDYIIYDTGSLFSTSILWTLFLPIGAFLLISHAAGIVWGIISILNSILFYVISENNLVDMKARIEAPVARLMDVVFVFSSVLAIIYIYERGRNRLTKKLLVFNTEIEKQNQELKELNKEREQLMSVVAHDLKAPFKTIGGFLKVMEVSGELNEQQLNCINLSNSVIHKSNKLINDLLYLHELNERSSFKELKPVDMNITVEKIVDSYRSAAQEKNIQLVSDNKLQNSEVNTYPEIISQIMDNLISNAIKFSPFGKKVLVSSYSNEKAIMLSVKDEGPGFTDKDKEKLFTRFQKLSARPTNKENSTGLGLSIVKKLIEMIDGEITVRSNKDEGAEFLVRIPVKQKQQEVQNV